MQDVHSALQARIFLVGCPRSGTTLLQSLLAAHPKIASFPESHFFVHLLEQRTPRQIAWGLASHRARPRFEQFLQEAGHAEMRRCLPRHAYFLNQYTRAFIAVLDTLTKKQSKDLWVEKTPDHVRHIDLIEKLVQGANFIHIVRNGADVVASLYEVTHQYPQIWDGPWGIDQCIRKWVTCIQSSCNHWHKSNHFLVSYEQLVRNPEVILNQLGEFIGIPLNYAALQSRKSMAASIVLKHEPWKNSVSKPLSSISRNKFNQLFDEAQRDYILNQIAQVNLDYLPQAEHLALEKRQKTGDKRWEGDIHSSLTTQA
ncbi:MAG: sulfotransferase [Cyanothece sp. SIO1E1]|nr:sulfotransferase [Cyanothece sp. SIO1E1]